MTATTVGGAVLRLRPSCAMLRPMKAIRFHRAATTPVEAARTAVAALAGAGVTALAGAVVAALAGAGAVDHFVAVSRSARPCLS